MKKLLIALVVGLISTGAFADGDRNHDHDCDIVVRCVTAPPVMLNHGRDANLFVVIKDCDKKEGLVAILGESFGNDHQIIDEYFVTRHQAPGFGTPIVFEDGGFELTITSGNPTEPLLATLDAFGKGFRFDDVRMLCTFEH